MKRIGVFVCHCGANIAGSVDVEKVVEEIKDHPGVVHAENYIYMCSDPGQERIRKAIEEKQLNGVVNCNCSPSLHEKTFRNLASSAGLNPYAVEIANIREHCSWPHVHDREAATRKAVSIVKMVVEKVQRNLELTPMVVPITKRALVIGGGIAGLQAAADIASAGYEVVLVERSPALGGRVSQLSETYPTMERTQCLAASKAFEVMNHPKVPLYLFSEVEEVEGYVGNFKVKVKSKARYVDWDRCTGCGACVETCPVEVASEYERGLKGSKAIDFYHGKAIPKKAVIDRSQCLYFKEGEQCTACQKVCPEKAVDYSQADRTVEEEVGSIVVATGHDLYDKEQIEEHDSDPDVIDTLQFERMLSLDGPTGGAVVRPSNGKIPREVVFVSCVGSRDPEHHLPYCSRVCCMVVAKQAALYKRAVPDGQAYVFYMDVRSDAKDFEEFVKDVVERDRVIYLRGRVSRIFRDGDKVVVWGADTLAGKRVEIGADLVVAAMAMIPSAGAKALSRRLNIISDEHGFMSEAHIKLRPVETLTAGIFLAGTAQAPRDIADTVSSASGAASKVLSLFSRRELLHEPEIAYVDEEVCAGCGLCVSICAYGAPALDERRRVARVNEALCEGCGACAALCPSGAMQQKNFSNRQFFEMIDVAAADYVDLHKE